MTSAPSENAKPVASDASVPVEDARFLRAMLEAIPAFVLRVDSEGRINYINQLLPGLDLGQVIGAPARDFVAAEDHPAFEVALAEAMRTGRAQYYQAKGVRSVNSGTPVQYDGHVVPLEQDDGRRAACIIALDVSERVARARELEESEAKLRLALDATGLGLFTWDMESDQAEIDRRSIELFGGAPKTASEYITHFVHPDDRERIANEASRTRDGSPRFPEHRIVRPDGEVRWVMTRGRAIRDADGGSRLIGGVLDVTARQRANQHLQQVQKLDAIGNLTAGLAHNFNNMLSVIGPALDLALRTTTERNRSAFEDAQHALDRAAELVKQLMTFAGQHREAHFQRQNLVPLVERAVSMCRNTFAHLPIEFDHSRSSGEVDCDAADVEQVVVNLLINARDALVDIPVAEARIVVDVSDVSASRPDDAATPPERYVRIRVRDNGSGINDAVRQRLFEPFFTTKAGKGTGLGLATSHAIVRDHGGFMVLEPEEPAGTSAQIFLPRAQ